MGSSAVVPADLVPCAIGELAQDGAIEPRTEAMTRWVERFGGRLQDVRLDVAQRDALAAGERVVLERDGAWQLERIERGGSVWLVVQDVSARETLAAALAATARCRALGQLAARLTHDLNNQFNAALAMVTHSQAVCEDEADKAALRDIESGVRSGARMVGAVARTLCRPVRRSELVAPAELLEDALAMVRKSLEVAGVGLEVAVADALPAVRVESAEAVYAIMNVLLALQDAGAASIACELDVADRAVARGRTRSCVVLRCTGRGVDSRRARELVDVLAGNEGAMQHVSRRPSVLESVAHAAFQLRRWGGEVAAETSGPDVTLAYVWPARRRAAAAS